MGLEARRRGQHGVEVGAGQGEQGAGGGGGGGVVPPGVRVQQGVLAEVVAVGEHAEDGLVAVLADASLADLAVRDQVDLVGGRAALDEHLARRELALDEAVGERGQHLLVLEAAQQRPVRRARGGSPGPSAPSWTNSTRPSPTV